MSTIELETIDRAIRISELIEEIIQLDELLALHQMHHASLNTMQQYIDRKEEFVIALNNLLRPHQLRMVVEEKAA